MSVKSVKINTLVNCKADPEKTKVATKYQMKIFHSMNRCKIKVLNEFIHSFYCIQCKSKHLPILNFHKRLDIS